MVTWEKVGGIQPTPFKVSIPAGCFIPNRGFHVEDFRDCRVELTVVLGEELVNLSIMEFEASLRPHLNRPASFVIETRFTDHERLPAILGALGGAAVEIAIGDEMGTALPVGVTTVAVPPSPI